MDLYSQRAKRAVEPHETNGRKRAMRALISAVPLAAMLLCGASALAANTSQGAATSTPPAAMGNSKTGTANVTGNASGVPAMQKGAGTGTFTTQAAAEQACGGASNVVWGNSS